MQYTLRGKINNVTPLTLDKTLSLEGASADAKAVGDAINEVDKKHGTAMEQHTGAENPHKVTASQVGLGNVDNTSDENKPVSTAQAKAIADAMKTVSDETSTKAVNKEFNGVFSASGWSSEAPYTQEITVDGVLVTDRPLVDIDLSGTEEPLPVIEGWGLVGRCTVSKDNSVTAYCYQDCPAVDIPVVIKVVR
jgi:hypothetical protein